MQHELEASFIYEDTPDQLKATQEVKQDMEKDRPMDRLICGDVGFGKTEVAIRAALRQFRIISRSQYWFLLRCWLISIIKLSVNASRVNGVRKIP